jgi:hypothetical protein
MAAPSYEQLIAFAAGELPDEQAAAVDAHVQRNAEAAAIMTAWRVVHETVRGDDGVNPSSAAIERARAIFAQRAAAAPASSGFARWLEGAQQFVARLVYDSRVQPAAVRFAGEDDRINLTFETDTGEVDLQAERLHSEDAGEQRWRIVGQISESASGSREVALARAGSRDAVKVVAADEHGVFNFETGPGAYDLLINRGMEAPAAERVVVLRSLELS